MRKHSQSLLLTGFSDQPIDGIYALIVSGVPDDPAIGVEYGHLTLTRAEMKRIMDPSIDKILSLASLQIKNAEKEGLHFSV